eukprot:s1492_g5.t1
MWRVERKDSECSTEASDTDEYVHCNIGKFHIDVVIAVEECACRFAFERYSAIAGIGSVVSAMSVSDLLTIVDALRLANPDRPLMVVVGERHWLNRLKSLPSQGRMPFVVDASDTGRSESHAKLAASCTQKEFETVLSRCHWWFDLVSLEWPQ